MYMGNRIEEQIALQSINKLYPRKFLFFPSMANRL